MTATQCRIDGCQSLARVRGLCARHYDRAWNHRSIELQAVTVALRERNRSP